MPKTLSGNFMTEETGPSFNIILSLGTHRFTLTPTRSLTCRPFVTIPATLTYDSDDQLTGSQIVYGTIGNSVNFIFENGPIANGTLEKPIVPQYEFKVPGEWNKGE